MPYKFQGKKYTQNEKHPLSKKRFEVSCELIDNFREESLTEATEINNNLNALQNLWLIKRDKVSFISV